MTGPDRYRARWWQWAAVAAALALTITTAALLGG